MDAATDRFEPTDRRARAVGSSALWPPTVIVVAAWGAVAPFVARSFGVVVPVGTAVEVVDHVIPGAVAVLAAGVTLARRAAGAGDDLVEVALAALVFFAGFFMAATHVSLVVDDVRYGIFPSAAMLFHAPGGFVLALLGAWRFGALLSRAPSDEPSSGEPAGTRPR